MTEMTTKDDGQGPSPTHLYKGQAIRWSFPHPPDGHDFVGVITDWELSQGNSVLSLIVVRDSEIRRDAQRAAELLRALDGL